MSDDERQIRDYIESHAIGRVQYVKWGPHAKAGTYIPLGQFLQPDPETIRAVANDKPPPKRKIVTIPEKVYRVVHKEGEDVIDAIYRVGPNGVEGQENAFGGDWLVLNEQIRAKRK